MTLDQIQDIIDRTGRPLAYIEGFAYFYGRKFFVNENVLIPRPETEDIIRVAQTIVADLAVDTRRPLEVLDVGTGSGIIAVTLALEHKTRLNITASDISQEALLVAAKNAEEHQVASRINFVQSDLFEYVPQKYDVICANLPYVDAGWTWLDRRALAYEPPIALYAEDGGLGLIKKLILGARDNLGPDGRLLLEADPVQNQDIIGFARGNGLVHVTTKGYVLCFARASALH